MMKSEWISVKPFTPNLPRNWIAASSRFCRARTRPQLYLCSHLHGQHSPLPLLQPSSNWMDKKRQFEWIGRVIFFVLGGSSVFRLCLTASGGAEKQRWGYFLLNLSLCDRGALDLSIGPTCVSCPRQILFLIHVSVYASGRLYHCLSL